MTALVSGAACVGFALTLAALVYGVRGFPRTWRGWVRTVASGASFLFLPVGAAAPMALAKWSAIAFILFFFAAVACDASGRESRKVVSDAGSVVFATASMIGALYLRGLPGDPASMEALGRVFTYGACALGGPGISAASLGAVALGGLASRSISARRGS